MIMQVKNIKVFDKDSILILENENKKYSISIYYKNKLHTFYDSKISFKNAFKYFKKEYPLFNEITWN